MSTTNQRDRPEAFARAPGSACDAGQAPAAPYRPSNGTEGDCFRAEFCLRCAKWRNGTCGIELRAMLHDTDEKGYPRQWVRGVTGPRCTAFRLKGTPPATRRGQRSAPGQSELFASPNALAAGRPPNGAKLSDDSGRGRTWKTGPG